MTKKRISEQDGAIRMDVHRLSSKVPKRNSGGMYILYKDKQRRVSEAEIGL